MRTLAIVYGIACWVAGAWLWFCPGTVSILVTSWTWAACGTDIVERHVAPKER